LVQLKSFVFSADGGAVRRRARVGRLREPAFARCATEGPGCAPRYQELGGCGNPPSRVALRRAGVLGFHDWYNLSHLFSVGHCGVAQPGKRRKERWGADARMRAGAGGRSRPGEDDRLSSSARRAAARAPCGARRIPVQPWGSIKGLYIVSCWFGPKGCPQGGRRPQMGGGGRSAVGVFGLRRRRTGGRAARPSDRLKVRRLR